MRVCLVSSSFYPAIFYGGPISSTWDLSKKLGEKRALNYIRILNQRKADKALLDKQLNN